MFAVDRADMDGILKDYGIFSETKCISELQRYDYEQNDYDSKEEVRLVVKVECASGPPLVVRFRDEKGVAIDVVESQSRFAEQLRKGGIITPHQYQSNGAFARWYQIKGYDVIVTVEQFAENEVKVVDAAAAEKTGELLAKMHTVSEKRDLHVENAVLFDPFSANDLFDFESFQALGSALGGAERATFDKIVRKYNDYMEILSPLKEQPRYAVQGDISDCNLYQTCSGEIGIFDFNRCGDNNLFCDAVMQAVFEAKLMDYPDDSGPDIEEEILTSFLKGYCSVRAFSAEQQNWYPYLCAVIHAFWSSDVKWSDDSLTSAIDNGDMASARKWLETIWQRLISLKEHVPAETFAGKISP